MKLTWRLQNATDEYRFDLSSCLTFSHSPAPTEPQCSACWTASGTHADRGALLDCSRSSDDMHSARWKPLDCGTDTKIANEWAPQSRVLFASSLLQALESRNNHSERSIGVWCGLARELTRSLLGAAPLDDRAVHCSVDSRAVVATARASHTERERLTPRASGNGPDDGGASGPAKRAKRCEPPPPPPPPPLVVPLRGCCVC